MMFDIFDQMTFAFQQDFGLYILLGAIVFGFVLSFAVASLSNFVAILREAINKKSHVSMDTFRTSLSPPLPPPPQGLRTLRGVFFLKARTSDSRQKNKSP